MLEEMWARQDRKEVLPAPFGHKLEEDMVFFQFPIELVTYFQEKRLEIRQEWLHLLSVREKSMKYRDGPHVKIQTFEEHAHRQKQRSQRAAAAAWSPW